MRECWSIWLEFLSFNKCSAFSLSLFHFSNGEYSRVYICSMEQIKLQLDLKNFMNVSLFIPSLNVEVLLTFSASYPKPDLNFLPISTAVSACATVQFSLLALLFLSTTSSYSKTAHHVQISTQPSMKRYQITCTNLPGQSDRLLVYFYSLTYL